MAEGNSAIDAHLLAIVSPALQQRRSLKRASRATAKSARRHLAPGSSSLSTISFASAIALTNLALAAARPLGGKVIARSRHESPPTDSDRDIGESKIKFWAQNSPALIPFSISWVMRSFLLQPLI